MPRVPSHPIPAVIVILKRNRRLLLVRRRNAPDAGFWGFPGGKIERGETIQAAAERELLEETGIVGQAAGILTALDVITTGPGRTRFHYVLIVVQCRYRRGRVRAADDATDAQWLSGRQIHALSHQLSRDVLEMAQAALSLRPRDAAPRRRVDLKMLDGRPRARVR